MRGYIRKRGNGSYQVSIFLGRDPVTGKQQSHYHTVNGNKKDAEKYLSKTLTEIDERRWKKPSEMTVSMHFDDWLAKGDQSRKKNQEFNRWVIGKYIGPALGHMRLDRLDVEHIEDCYNGLIRGGLQAGSVKRIHAVFASSMKWARRLKRIRENPFDLVDVPKVPTKRKKAILTLEEVREFLQAAQEDRHIVLWLLAFETGLRPCEFLGLRWQDIDLDRGDLWVNHSLVWHKGGSWELTLPKSENATRRLSLSSRLVMALKEQRERQAKQLATSGTWHDLDFVFSTTVGTPIRIENLTRRHFKPILKAAGLRERNLYMTRHTMATLLNASKQVTIAALSERLGHSDSAFTYRTYIHSLPGMQEHATEVMSQILFGEQP